MSDDRSRTCPACSIEWRGPASCWACGAEGEITQRSYFSGASWRVADYDRDMAEPAKETA